MSVHVSKPPKYTFGGGTPAGGTAHAGHGFWSTAFTPGGNIPDFDEMPDPSMYANPLAQNFGKQPSTIWKDAGPLRQPDTLTEGTGQFLQPYPQGGQPPPGGGGGGGGDGGDGGDGTTVPQDQQRVDHRVPALMGKKPPPAEEQGPVNTVTDLARAAKGWVTSYFYADKEDELTGVVAEKFPAKVKDANIQTMNAHRQQELEEVADKDDIWYDAEEIDTPIEQVDQVFTNSVQIAAQELHERTNPNTAAEHTERRLNENNKRTGEEGGMMMPQMIRKLKTKLKEPGPSPFNTETEMAFWADVRAEAALGSPQFDVDADIAEMDEIQAEIDFENDLQELQEELSTQTINNANEAAVQQATQIGVPFYKLAGRTLKKITKATAQGSVERFAAVMSWAMKHTIYSEFFEAYMDAIADQPQVNIQFPNVSMPSMPNVQLPSMPNVQFPSIPTMPNIQFPSMPNIHLPNVQLPSMSSLRLPKINLPTQALLNYFVRLPKRDQKAIHKVLVAATVTRKGSPPPAEDTADIGRKQQTLVANDEPSVPGGGKKRKKLTLRILEDAKKAKQAAETARLLKTYNIKEFVSNDLVSNRPRRQAAIRADDRIKRVGTKERKINSRTGSGGSGSSEGLSPL